ncbi:MAG: hypothetical protein ACR2GZ_07190 [Solirubrobacteraceae bacterium]
MGHRAGAGVRHHAASAAAGGPLRIVALVERGRRGQRVLAEVLELAQAGAVEVTLIAVVAHANGRGCAVSPAPLNAAIDQAATDDLDAVALRLPLSIPVVDRRVMPEGGDPSPAEWVSASHFDVVLMAGRRRWRASRVLGVDSGLPELDGGEVRSV